MWCTDLTYYEIRLFFVETAAVTSIQYPSMYIVALFLSTKTYKYEFFNANYVFTA